MSLEPREAQKIEDALKGKDLDRLVDLIVRFENVYIETLREIANLKENEEYYKRAIETRITFK